MTISALAASAIGFLLGELMPIMPGRGLHTFVYGDPAAPPACMITATLQQEQTPSALYEAALQAMQKKDYIAAETMLRQVLALNSRYQAPSGCSAWYQLGRALEQQEQPLEAIHVLEQGRDSLQYGDQPDWYLNYDLARLYAENRIDGREGEITDLLYRVLKNSTPERQHDLWQRLFHETAFLLDEPERAWLARSLSAPGGQPGRLLLHFFLREDPYPLTRQNESLIVFFQRSAEARTRFAYALSPRGYDERGDIYVRLGKPWRVHKDHSGIMGDVGWAIHPYEVWFYNTIHPDLYFTFIRKEGKIHYTLADGPESIFGTFYRGRRTFFNRRNVGQTAMYLRDEIYRSLAPSHETFRRRLYEISNLSSDAEALNYALLHFPNDDRKHAAQVDSIAPAVVFSEDYKQKSLPIELSFARFHGEEGKTRTEIYYGGLYRDLQFKRSPDGYQAHLRGEIAILDAAYELVASDSIREDCFAPTSAATDRGDFVSQTNFLLNPARYHLFFRLHNPEGKQVGVLRSDLAVVSFSETSLSLSDIQLSPHIRPANATHRFVKNGYFVVPLPGLTTPKDQPLYVYFEIYNLSFNNSGETTYHLDYRVSEPERKKGFFSKIGGLFGGKGGKKYSITLSESRTGHSPNQVEYVALDLGKFSGGSLELEISVTDENSNQHVSSTVPIKLVDKQRNDNH